MTPQFLRQIIHKDTQFRSLPTNISYLLKALTEDNLTHLKIAAIISKYPSIVARLIFLANSAWVAPIEPIVTLEMACSRLGLSMVRSVSISLSVSMPFSTAQCQSFDQVRFWSSALLVADGAVWLAKHIPNVSDHDLKLIHTAGLLHNIGLLWMVDRCSKKTAIALESVAADPLLSTTDALIKSVGIDYCEVGEILGNAWELPTVLVTVMAQHRNLDFHGTNYHYVLPVALSTKMVSALYKGIIETPYVPDALLKISHQHLDAVYSKLSDKANDYLELAKLLFTD